MGKNEVYEIKVYGKENKVVKTCQAKEADLMFGTIRTLMALLKVDDIDNTKELFGIIYEAWDELVVVLSAVFPDMEPDDWDHVYVKELIPVIIGIMKASFIRMLSIPNESKN